MSKRKAEAAPVGSPITPPVPEDASSAGAEPEAPAALAEAPVFGGLPPTAAAMVAAAEAPVFAKVTRQPPPPPEPAPDAPVVASVPPAVRAVKFVVNHTMSVGGQTVTFTRGRVLAEHEVFPQNWVDLLERVGRTVEVFDVS